MVKTLFSRPNPPVNTPMLWVLGAVACVSTGCGPSVSLQHSAPVESRTVPPRKVSPTTTTTTTVLTLPPAPAADTGAEAAKPPKAEPGSYIVKPGDTLIRIGLDNGQTWKDIARWNNLDNPDRIEVGQVLRVIPPGVDPNSVAVTRPLTPPKVDSKPIDPKPAGAAASPAPAVPAQPPSTATVDDVQWSWPAAGAVVTSFGDNRSKGVLIGGKAGDPVLAAADGKVAYAGSGLRGYGNLVILKHNDTYLTAYAHNQALLVKEDQQVRRGQKIAEMGASDAERVQLHFELRRKGTPIDPVKLLPQR